MNLPEVGSGSRSGAAVLYVISNDQGVPTGIVGSPLVLNEIVPDAARVKRLARAGVVATAKRVNKRRAAFTVRVVIATVVFTFW